jgi:glycosidase
MISATNLLTQFKQPAPIPAAKPAVRAPITPAKSGLLLKYLDNQAAINIAKIYAPSSAPVDYKNDLRTLFKNNSAKILAINVRAFNAQDKNGNGYIDGGEQHGTFLNAIERLDELKDSKFNAIHMLPIHPPGKQKAMGTAGSLYSPANFFELDPVLIEKNDPRTPDEQFKTFIDECHKRGIKVIVDLPSCASYDMFLRQPELMAMESDGLAKTPQGWNDIRMFEPWKDEDKRILNPALLNLHKRYVDWCTSLGADGIRADVARAKPVEFWEELIAYSHCRNPEFGWIAETYTYEDASPQANMPHDRPQDSLRAGFDMIYGQYHIFNEWAGASEFMDYVKEQLLMSDKLPKGKSLLGSFATHDDISPMFHGGADYCNLTTGLQATMPMLNPYIVDGYQRGDWYLYPYANKQNPTTATDSHEMTVHHGKLDIFNLSRKPGGDSPEIGAFMKSCFELKDKYADVINKGSFIELEKEGDKTDQVIAYARHYNGKTLLVVANKNVNRAVGCKIKIPGLNANQELNNLLPAYGQESTLQAASDELRVNLGAGRVHVFEINTPHLERVSGKVYRQNI